MDLIIASRAHGGPQEGREFLSDLSCKISSCVYFFRVKSRKYWSFFPYCASMDCLVKRPMVRK